MQELQHMEATDTNHFLVQVPREYFSLLTYPVIASKDQDKFDEQDREFVMLIKLSVIDEMLTEVQTSKTSSNIWTHLKYLHDTSDKGRAFS
jgi:hypothetical protein